VVQLPTTSVAVAVGQDEDARAFVRRTDVGRSEHVPLRIVPAYGQGPENLSEPPTSHETWDVLQQDERGLHLANHPLDVVPDPPLVIGASSLASAAPRLARESSSDEIHASTPRSTIEGGHVRPDRRWIQVARFHLSDQDRACESFPLHVTDSASRPVGGDSEPEFEPSIPGT
jgi:hypothetical protein